MIIWQNLYLKENFAHEDLDDQKSFTSGRNLITRRFGRHDLDKEGTEMANRNNRTDGELDKLTIQDRAAALSFNSRDTAISARRKTSFDDLIVSLASAHENRRARQVTEWESLRSQSLRHWA